MGQLIAADNKLYKHFQSESKRRSLNSVRLRKFKTNPQGVDIVDTVRCKIKLLLAFTFFSKQTHTQSIFKFCTR